MKAGQRAELAYIGLESIESNTGRFNEGGLSKTPEVPLANSFRFGPEHVLCGKLRPYLNKVALAEFEGKCSTEIIPLLPSPDLDRRFLAYFLRLPRTVSRISEKTAGARMPRADMDFIFSLELVLPSLTEQRRIVDLLSRAEGIVRLRRDAQRKAAELIPAIFLDMFGNPATNPKDWSVVLLGGLITTGPQNGLYKHSSFYGSGTPILRIDAFYDGLVSDFMNLKRLRLDDTERTRFSLVEGDLVINRVNSPEYLGKSALIPALPDSVVFESNMMRFAIDQHRADPGFIIQLLQTQHAKCHFLTNAKHAINQSSINQQDVKSLTVPVPPLAMQQAFKRHLDSVSSIIAQQAEASGKAKASFDALLANAFAEA